MPWSQIGYWIASKPFPKSRRINFLEICPASNLFSRMSMGIRLSLGQFFLMVLWITWKKVYRKLPMIKETTRCINTTSLSMYVKITSSISYFVILLVSSLNHIIRCSTIHMSHGLSLMLLWISIPLFNIGCDALPFNLKRENMSFIASCPKKNLKSLRETLIKMGRNGTEATAILKKRKEFQ